MFSLPRNDGMAKKTSSRGKLYVSLKIWRMYSCMYYKETFAPIRNLNAAS
jgi:hypothetical protein